MFVVSLQKIRTVELDGKVIKLQIVSIVHKLWAAVSAQVLACAHNIACPCSGTQQDRSASEQSPAATTVVLMASL